MKHLKLGLRAISFFKFKKKLYKTFRIGFIHFLGNLLKNCGMSTKNIECGILIAKINDKNDFFILIINRQRKHHIEVRPQRIDLT